MKSGSSRNEFKDLDAVIGRVTVYSTAAAVIGLSLCVAGYFAAPDRFYSAWLIAFIYWQGIAIGSLALTLIHGMTGGQWGIVIRRVLESAFQTLPLLSAASLPILLGVGAIYAWADPEFVEHHHTLAAKSNYLNVDGFQLRGVMYFLIWIIISWVLLSMSPTQEPDSDTERAATRQRNSAIAFILYGFTATLAAVDWVVSLEPEWYSTMYGLIHIAGQGVMGLSWSILIATSLRTIRPWSKSITPERLNDLGNLLLAAVMFWAYCHFFQFLVIWCGNLPEENVWYVHRSRNGWQYLIMILFAFDFAVPFLLLLWRARKRRPADLGRIAAALLVMRYIELYWLIVPGFAERRSTVSVHWLDLAAFIALGGLWVTLFSLRLACYARIPIEHPELKDAIHERGHKPVIV